MSTVHTDRLVEDYLHRLEAAARAAALPPPRRAELVAEIREHVEEALRDGPRDEAAVRNVLERLGPPEEVASDAADGPVSAQAAGWNGLAIASFVLGLLWIWWIGSTLALVFGYRARRQIKASGGSEQGSGLAVAGIVLGWVGIAVLLLGGLSIVAAGPGSVTDQVPVPAP